MRPLLVVMVLLAGVPATAAPPPQAGADEVFDESMIAALRDRPVIINKPDGSQIRGRLIGGDKRKIVLQIKDGRLVAIGVEEVDSLQLDTPRTTAPAASQRANEDAKGAARAHRLHEAGALEEQASQDSLVALGTMGVTGLFSALGLGATAFTLFIYGNIGTFLGAALCTTISAAGFAWGAFSYFSAEQKKVDAGKIRREAEEMAY